MRDLISFAVTKSNPLEVKMSQNPLKVEPSNTQKNMTTAPEYHQHEEFQNRSRKLEEIRSMGMDPYPHKFAPKNNAQTLHHLYDQEDGRHTERCWWRLPRH